MGIKSFLYAIQSLEMFIRMINSAAYQDIVVHRTAALKDSRLIATRENENPRPP